MPSRMLGARLVSGEVSGNTELAAIIPSSFELCMSSSAVWIFASTLNQWAADDEIDDNERAYLNPLHRGLDAQGPEPSSSRRTTRSTRTTSAEPSPVPATPPASTSTSTSTYSATPGQATAPCSASPAESS